VEAIRIAGRLAARRAVLSVARQARTGASREVHSPTALTGHAALSGAAGLRTIPLRRWPRERPGRSGVPISRCTGLALAVLRSAREAASAMVGRRPRRLPSGLHRRRSGRDATQPAGKLLVAWPGTDEYRSRRRSWGSSLRSVGPVRGWPGVSARPRPPAVFRASASIVFRGTGRR